MLTPSMLSDVCDFDELQTGLRREGAYTSVWSFLLKASGAGGVAISGLILAGCGYDNKLVQQTADTVLKMRIWYAITPTVLILAAILLISHFPITEQMAHQIRAKLDSRATDRHA